MIGFADTAWQAFTLFGVFVLGFFLVPQVVKWFGVPFRHGMILYLWHTGFCIVYLLYSMYNPADSVNYFLRSLSFDEVPELGTPFVVAFTSLFTQGLGLSYGGAFLVFNIFGTVGLIAFSAALRAEFGGKSRRTRRFVTLLPFLPGFSFWSAAIGKDSLAFFGIGLICWAAADPYKRILVIVFGLIAIGLVRPHIAGFLLIALAFAFTFGGGRNLAAKAVISAILVPATAAVITLSLDFVGLEEAESASDLSDYLTARQGYNLGGGSSVDIAGASVPVRLFTYVFRPLFFDAGGAFGLAVSAENLILLAAFALGLVGLVKRRSNLTRFQRAFFFLFVAISWAALANTTANLGIAIRQKTMFTPMLLMLVLSYFPAIRYRNPVRVPHPAANPSPPLPIDDAETALDPRMTSQIGDPVP